MDYESMKVIELKRLARDRGLRNYSRMRKDDLLALIRSSDRTSGGHSPG